MKLKEIFNEITVLIIIILVITTLILISYRSHPEILPILSIIIYVTSGISIGFNISNKIHSEKRQ